MCSTQFTIAPIVPVQYLTTGLLLGSAVLAVAQALIEVVEPQVRPLDVLVGIGTSNKSLAVLAVSEERSSHFGVQSLFVQLLED